MTILRGLDIEAGSYDHPPEDTISAQPARRITLSSHLRRCAGRRRG
jgi:hypothetical protein